jgi:hypothetical protein
MRWKCWGNEKIPYRAAAVWRFWFQAQAGLQLGGWCDVKLCPVHYTPRANGTTYQSQLVLVWALHALVKPKRPQVEAARSILNNMASLVL